MTRFLVSMIRTRKVIEQAEVEVEACNIFEAKDKAADDDLEWQPIEQETSEPSLSAYEIGES